MMLTPADQALLMTSLNTLAASWTSLAGPLPDAEVDRRPDLTVAIFPSGPEREFYNNAFIVPGADQGHEAVSYIQAAYRAANVDGYAIWAHETDTPVIAELRDCGFQLSETTRAMGIELAQRSLSEEREWPIATRSFQEYRDAFLPAGLLAHVDDEVFRVLVAQLDGKDAAIALAFDCGTDCGIFNVYTAEWARRTGLARALTTRQLLDARGRGHATATLQATPMAERVYTQAGFRDLGRILEFTPRSD